MKKIKLSITLVFYFLVNSAYCQNINFLDKEIQLLITNPAQTGNNSYEWNIYNTINSKQIISNNKLNSLFLNIDYSSVFLPYKISIGGGILHNIFQNSPVQSNKFFISNAIERKFRNKLLRVGFSAAINNRSLLMQSLEFPDQYDSDIGRFNSSLSTQEVISDPTINYFDLNVGVEFIFSNNNLIHEFGLSFLHINTPNISYNALINNLKIENSIFYQVKINVFNKTVVQPFLILNTLNKNWDKTIGCDAIYGIRKQGFIIQSIITGIHLQVINSNYPTSLIFKLGTNYKKFNFNVLYNYFVTTGKLVPGQLRTVEISILYHGFSYNLEKYSIPCQLY